MLKNTRTITGYYLLVVGFLAIQAILTVYQGGQVIAHGKTVSQLEREKVQLAAQSYLLKQTIAQSNSLLHITQSPVYNQFQPMAGIIKVDQHLTVASR